jgi:hypothetical protein
MTRFRFKLKGGYVIGALEIPTDIGSLTIATVGGSKADALMRAGTIAQRIADDPVMSALIPPQAHTAIAAAKALSVAAKRGPKAIKSLWGKLKGAGKKRLAEALTKEVGAKYFGKEYRFEQPNRGAWQRYQDPYDDDADGYDDDAESYDEAGGFDAYELGRRKKRRKGKGRGRGRARAAQSREPEPPLDEPPPPYDEPPPPYDEPPPPGYEYAPEETSDIVDEDGGE